jgi:hypothetical protein
MPRLTEATILKRAKELCEKNGTAWDIEMKSAQPGQKLVGVIDEAGRKKYLALAKEQLLKEHGE